MADGSIPVTPGAGASMRALTNSGVQNGAFQQVVTAGDQFGVLQPSDPDGSLAIDTGSTSLFIDSFDVSLANFTTGGNAPTIAGSQVTFVSNTTASSVSSLRTNQTYLLRANSYIRAATYVRFETAAQTNNTRVWGLGTLQGSPTAASPVLNGLVFQLDYADGLLYAYSYNNGTGTKLSTALTRASDGNQHRYDIWYRQSTAYWVIDGVPVYSRAYPSLNIWQSPYWIAASVNFTTAPSAAPTFIITSISIADTAQNARSIGDGTNLNTQATVKAASTSAATTDTSLVVAINPQSPIVPGTAATNLGKARGGTPGTTDTGLATLGIRAPAVPVALNAAGNYVPALLDSEGKVIVAGTGDTTQSWQAAISLASTSQTAVKASAGSGLRNYVTDLVITSTSTTATTITVQDGATAMGIYVVALNNPVTVNFGTPLKGTAATAVNVTASAANQCYVSATGYAGV